MSNKTAICFVCDRNYLPYAIANAFDIYNNNIFDINIFIEDETINYNDIKKYPDGIKYHLNVLNIPDFKFNNNKWQKIIFGRLFVADFVKSEKIIILDVDILVLDNLKFIDEIELGQYTIAAVADIKSILCDENEKKLWLSNIGVKDNYYFNSGVLIINREKWQKINFKKELIKYFAKYGQFANMPDQDFLNYIFQSAWLELDPSFNFQVAYKDYALEKIYNPIIMHFICEIKPWDWNNYLGRKETKKHFNTILINAGFKSYLKPLNSHKFSLYKKFRIKYEFIISLFGLKTKRYKKQELLWNNNKDKIINYYKNNENLSNNAKLISQLNNYQPMPYYNGNKITCVNSNKTKYIYAYLKYSFHILGLNIIEFIDIFSF